MLMSEYPVVSVHIPMELRALAGGHDEVMASGETVGEVLRAVGHAYPDFAMRVLCADGQLADSLKVYLGACAQPKDLMAPVEQEEVLSIIATGDVACVVPGSRTGGRATSPPETLISIGD
ncbi:hypothetical protein AB6Q56_17325 [Dechloromonas sp. ARDL1]|uniref:hypothetical protein n=1 Tax=Dechloromonas sp. ARDL1 TaxID=3322121 RepID=UPI003DA7074A